MLIPNDMSLTKLWLDSRLFKAKLLVRRNDARLAASYRYLSLRSASSIAEAGQAGTTRSGDFLGTWTFRSNEYARSHHAYFAASDDARIDSKYPLRVCGIIVPRILDATSVLSTCAVPPAIVNMRGSRTMRSSG
jgi:hypothetical protein